MHYRSWPARLAALLLLLAVATALRAQLPIPGREFQVLSPPLPVTTGERIEVIEFFYYGCPVCYESQPHISRWLVRAGAGVALMRVPVISKEGEGWESFARTYFTLDALGELGRLHWPLYDNHHFDGKKLNEEKSLLEWIASNGVDAKKFAEVWHSPETAAKLEQATRLRDAYGVAGVPTVIVDGKFRTSARLAGGVKELLTVVDALVARARAERRAK